MLARPQMQAGWLAVVYENGAVRRTLKNVREAPTFQLNGYIPPTFLHGYIPPMFQLHGYIPPTFHLHGYITSNVSPPVACQIKPSRASGCVSNQTSRALNQTFPRFRFLRVKSNLPALPVACQVKPSRASGYVSNQTFPRPVACEIKLCVESNLGIGA
jgi:hypothetical protein